MIWQKLCARPVFWIQLIYRETFSDFKYVVLGGGEEERGRREEKITAGKVRREVGEGN